jgi:hypothetical protein
MRRRGRKTKPASQVAHAASLPMQPAQPSQPARTACDEANHKQQPPSPNGLKAKLTLILSHTPTHPHTVRRSAPCDGDAPRAQLIPVDPNGARVCIGTGIPARERHAFSPTERAHLLFALAVQSSPVPSRPVPVPVCLPACRGPVTRRDAVVSATTRGSWTDERNVVLLLAN